MDKKIFILIPAYNAERTLESVFDRIPQNIKDRVSKYVVSNNASTDDTLGVCERLRHQYPNLVVLDQETNKGYGGSEKAMLRYSLREGADIAILLHSDGQYSPEELPRLLKPFYEENADIVQGSRMLNGGALKGGMPMYKYIANKCLTAVENWAFGMKLAEYHSGYMIYSRRCLENVPFERLSNSFDIDVEMIVMAKLMNLNIKEMAIPTIYAEEKSHLNPITYGLDVLAIVRGYLSGKYHRLCSVQPEVTPLAVEELTAPAAAPSMAVAQKVSA